MKRSKALKISKAKGALHYWLDDLKGPANKVRWDSFTVDKNTGKITAAKGLAKGTYRLKIEVKANGTSKYNPISKTAKVVVKIK